MMFVYYNDVGDILYTTSAPVDGADGDYIEIEGDQIDLSHKVVVDGALQPRPGWQAAALREAREAASLSKTRLIGAIIEGQLLPENEIRQMMRGDIPDSLQPALDGMDPQARLHAENAWHNDTEISRNHPVIQAAAYVMGLSDEVVDQIFGVAITSP